MKIERENLLIQVKYSDLVQDRNNIGKYFLGFGAELYLSPEEIDKIDYQLVETIKSFAVTHHLPLRIHAPITEIDYSRIEDTITRMHHLYRKVIELCRMLDVPSVVAHAEFNYHIALSIHEQLENGVALWKSLLKDLSANSITLTIENHYEIQPDHLIMLMKKINSPYLGMCVDVGHFNAFGNLDVQRCLEKYPIGSVKEVHLTDNRGDGDTHLVVGCGNIDFMQLFETFGRRKERCVFVLEPNGIEEAQHSLLFLRKGGFLD